MNILMTVDKNYIHPLTVMLKSFARNGSIVDSSHEIYNELYAIDLEDHFYAAASHVGRLGTKFNELRIDGEDGMLYINTGVLLMNLSLLRQEQKVQPVLDYIQDHPFGLLLPDQDIICALYSTRIRIT